MCGRFANGVPNANEVERRVAREYFEEDAPEPDWSRPEQASADEEAAKEHGAGPASSQAASGSQGAGVGTSAVTKTFEWAPGAVFKPRYNISPRCRCLIIRRNDRAKPDNSLAPYVCDVAQFGLVPSWFKEPNEMPLSTINARSEAVASGVGMWKSLRSSHRCIVIAEGFYEWKASGSKKIPHFIKREDGQLLVMAGMHDEAFFQGNFDPVKSFTIITVDANKQLSSLHTRMPSVLTRPADIRLWLSATPYGPSIEALLQPFAGRLEIYKVPLEVGNVKNEDASFVRPITEKKGNIASMFALQTASQSPSKPSRPNSTPPKAKDLRLNPDDAVASSSKPLQHSSTKRERKEDEGNSDSSIEVVAASPSKEKGKLKAKEAPAKKKKKKRIEVDEEGNPLATNFFK